MFHMVDEHRVEVRVELPAAEVAVLDGFCAATGRSRTEVVREVLGRWSRDRLHEATLICRVAGVNPTPSDIASGGTGMHGEAR